MPRRASTMTARQFDATLKQLGLSVYASAKVLCISLRQAQRYVSVRGKGLKVAPLKLGPWRWPAFVAISAWLAFTVAIPLAGITLRSFVVTWGEGVNLADVLTLDHYREIFDYPNVARSITNTLLIGMIGGAAAVVCYTAIALSVHRWQSQWTRLVDYLVMLPRAI